MSVTFTLKVSGSSAANSVETMLNEYMESNAFADDLAAWGGGAVCHRNQN